MKISIWTATFLGLLNTSSWAQNQPGIEILGSSWEKGVAEVSLRLKYPVQSSGAVGETIVKARCEGLIQKLVADNRDDLSGIMRNSNGTLVGFNFRPATEVNQIYVAIRGKDEQLHVYQNLSLILIEQLAPIQRGFTAEDRDYFFLTSVSDNGLGLEYRGPKLVNPPIKPFRFEMEIAPTGQLQLRRQSIKQF